MAESSTITREMIKAAGFVLVPREPTGEMYGAGGVAQFKADFAMTPVREAVGSVYRAMIAAAPASDPELVARALDEVADTASPVHADRCRRLAAALRQPGFEEVRL